MSLDRIGIWFYFRGDEVCLLWPWKWKDGRKFLSIGFEGSFKSLHDISEMWGSYFGYEEGFSVGFRAGKLLKGKE